MLKRGGVPQVARDFYPFVEEGSAHKDAAEKPCEVTHPARIAVYDDASAAPRVVMVEPKDVREYLEEITGTVNRLSHEQGGTIPFMVIREIVENFIHAYFQAPTITILDGGNTIRFSDQGPGIKEKRLALEYGTSSATEEMKHYIRGVGSGLPYAQQYMVDKGGSLEIEDNIQGGTVVTISTHPAGEARAVSKSEGPAGENPGGFGGSAYGAAAFGAPGAAGPAGFGGYGSPAGAWGGAPQGAPAGAWGGWQQPAYGQEAWWAQQAGAAAGWQQPGAAAPQQGYPQQQNPWQQVPYAEVQQPGAPQALGAQVAWPEQTQAAPQPMMQPAMSTSMGATGMPGQMPTAPVAQPQPAPTAPAQPATFVPQVTVDERGQQALAYLAEHGSAGPTDLSAAFGSSNPTWSRALGALAAQGLVIKAGQKYQLTQIGHTIAQQ